MPYEVGREIKVVLVNGWYILGEEVKAFENNFAVIVERTIALEGMA
jgi:dTDP-4-amino-4,6-dideoxygalactose transaminase